MSDDAPTPAPAPTPSLPIVVDPSVTGGLLATGIRQIALVAGGFAAALGFAGNHDWVGFWGYLASDGFTTAMVALLTIGVFVYGQWKGWKEAIEKIYIARRVRNNVAVVKGETDHTPL